MICALRVVMGYTRRRWNIMVLFLLTIVEFWNVILSDSVDINFTHYQPDPHLAGYRCVRNETVFESGKVRNAYQCSKLCAIHDTCLSVFYQPHSYKCIGCRVNLWYWTGKYEPFPGSVYIHTKSDYISETDCKDILEKNGSAPSGLYEISTWRSKTVVTVYCQMDPWDDPWTVFQRRSLNSTTNFNRNFSEYENGFGAIDGDFWLDNREGSCEVILQRPRGYLGINENESLKFVREMTSQGETDLRMDLLRFQDMYTWSAIFESFYLDKGPRYTLHLGSVRIANEGTPTTEFLQNAGQRFSTYDEDRDSRPAENCAATYRGGWWYNGNCTKFSLNGDYVVPGTNSSGQMFFKNGDNILDFKSSKLMFRR